VVQVLHPAVDPIVPYSEKVVPSSSRWGIVVLGRFFEGRQNKGHEQAIQLFHQVRLKVGASVPPEKLRLTLMGHPMPGEVSAEAQAWCVHL
jgi:hypothetical protein